MAKHDDETQTAAISSRPRTRRGVTAPDTDRAAEPQPGATVTPPGARFHFFLIDSGWNSSAARVIRENIAMITRFQNNDPLFILDQSQSTALLRRHPHLIGKDPILLARDLRARGAAGTSEYHGFHLNMGLIKDPVAAVEGLRKFLHFLAMHRQSTDIERDVQQQLHRAGLKGAIEVLRQSGEALVGG